MLGLLRRIMGMALHSSSSSSSSSRISGILRGGRACLDETGRIQMLGGYRDGHRGVNCALRGVTECAWDGMSVGPGACDLRIDTQHRFPR